MESFRGHNVLSPAMNQMLLTNAMGRAGHEVQLVENGQLAVDAIMANTLLHFDLVLMDINMPVMDGVTATRAIRALVPPMNQVPIIGISADAMPHEKERYLQTGLTDYVTKPIQGTALFNAMRKVVESREAS